MSGLVALRFPAKFLGGPSKMIPLEEDVKYSYILLQYPPIVYISWLPLEGGCCLLPKVLTYLFVVDIMQ